MSTSNLLRGFLITLLALVLAPSLHMLYGGQAQATDLTGTAAGRLTVELLTSDAQFHNTLSLVTPTASVALTGCKLEPATGLTGVPLLSEKTSQHGCRVEVDSDPSTAGIIEGFSAGTTFRFGMCAQEDTDPDCEYVWSSNPSSNSDNFDHVIITPIYAAEFPGKIFQLAWEDKPDGGDNDFNDLVAVVRISSDSDGDGLWDDWEQFGVDTDGNGTVDLDLPALGANSQHKDVFLEIDYMDCTVTGSDCPAGDTHNHMPKTAAINAVIQAFANAPVSNPDSINGISLHVDVSNAIAHQKFLDIPSSLPGGCNTSPLPSGIGSFDAVKSDPANFGDNNPRRFAYHYDLFIDRRGPSTSSSGCSELPGQDTVVSLGDWNAWCIGPGTNGVLNTSTSGDDVAILGQTQGIFAGPNLVCNTTASGGDVQFVAVGSSPTGDMDGDTLDDRNVGTVQQQAGTLIHEFGHNLDLRHGGDENKNFKPNYISAMNYRFQFGIAPTDPDGSGPLTGRVDYSRTALSGLDELYSPPTRPGLSEPAGIGDGTDNTGFFCPGQTQSNSSGTGTGPGTGAINWNCDTDSTDTGAATGTLDINGDGASDLLTGYDDWQNLKYDFQNTVDFEDGSHLSELHDDIDYPTSLIVTTQLVNIDIKPGSDPNSIKLKNEKIVTVAVLGSASLDVKTINLVTLRFGPNQVSPTRTTFQDVNADGFLDLVTQFKMSTLGLTTSTTSACIDGSLNNANLIHGCDAVRVFNK